MQTSKRHSFHRLLFALGIAFPGLIGILAVQAKSGAMERAFQLPALQAAATLTATETPMPPLTATLPVLTSTELPTLSLPTSVSVFPSGLYAFIEAPIGPVSQPYVILTAFSALPTQVSIVIRGFINSAEFICTASPCAINLQTSSRLVFAAYADSGQSSETVIASVSVTQTDNGYLVTIDSVSQFQTFADSCGVAWNLFDQSNITWNDFVQFPFELHTKKTLHSLATQLLINGIVDASDCPTGGLSLGLDWPTACGLERASSAMIEWQNQYDGHIWLASKDYGVPPKILKTLIEVETQFWPGNSRFYLDEYGLGQVNQLGIDVLLRRDPTLYQRVCPSVLADCLKPYLSLEPQQQAMIRGAVVKLMDASCADCEYGFDLNKAKESIALLAMLLRANCQQVEVIINLVHVPDDDVDAATATAAVATIAAGGETDTTSYEDLWRFTLLSYHSGLNCFQEALTATRKAHKPFTWENVEERLRCKGGANYVNGFMNNLFAFDFYRLDYTDTSVVFVAPTIIPTRTPVPTPTAFVSNATVRVQVFMDRNGNGTPEDEEWIDSVPVLLVTSTNEQVTQRTENGIAIFDMSGYTPGIGVNVSLPGLYREQRFELPQEGEVTVTFMFELPVLPTNIP